MGVCIYIYAWMDGWMDGWKRVGVCRTVVGAGVMKLGKTIWVVGFKDTSPGT